MNVPSPPPPLPERKADGHKGTSPAGAFPADGYGLCDAAGNVREWTADPFRMSAGDGAGYRVLDLDPEEEVTTAFAPQVRERMEVVGSDGQRGRHADDVEGGMIRLAARLPVLLATLVALSALCSAPPVFAQGPRQE